MIKAAISLFGTLMFAVLIAGCNQDDEPIIPEDTDFYVSFLVDGVQTRFENGVNDYGNGPGRVSYLDGVGPLNSQFTFFSTSSENPSFGRNTFKIQMVEVKSDSITPTYQETYQLFSEGIYDFGATIEDSITGGTNGVVIEFVDADSVVWTTDSKLNPQEGWANFEITSHEESGSDLFGAKTTGTFNCRVFNGGNHLDLMNGTFRARTVFKEQ
jgi:hypothetical protein